MGIGSGFEYIDTRIARLEQRIKRIRENPDPTKPKSNILLYQLQRDLLIKTAEAVKVHKPLAGTFTNICEAMDMHYWWAVLAADRSAGPMADMYFKMIREEGMAEHTCDRTIVVAPMVLRGDYPKPDFFMITNHECTPMYMSSLMMANVLDVPYFIVDRKFVPFRPLEDEGQLKYITNQLLEMIDFVEAKFPQCKYDEDKLIEREYYLREILLLERQQWKLRAAVPCPIAPLEAFREMLLYDNATAQGLEYTRCYTEEIGERVAKGQSGLPEGVEEKLRFLWSNTGPFHHDPFTWLGSKGVSIPASLMTTCEGWRSGREPIWGDPWRGRKLTPVEEEARQLDLAWGRLGERWIDYHLNVSRDLKIDGIVYFVQWGCTATNTLGKMVADVVERELGIPTLIIEGRQLDSTSWDEKDFFSRLEEFIAIAEAAKKRRAFRRQEIGG